MSELERAAIVGTGQLSASDAEHTGTAVDELVAQLPDNRERALLLRAGGLALLTRAARPPVRQLQRPTPANQETLRPASARLAELLSSLFDGGSEEVLVEALGRMAEAGMRLPEELLPLALCQRGALRTRLRPVLGARGSWLAHTREEWAWARSTIVESLPRVLEARWDDASAAERKLLLAAARAADPARARQLAEASWKQEKAEQRLAWLEIFETNLSPDDEAFLTGVLLDRSAPARIAAARLLWRLPESQLAKTLRARVESLFALAPPRTLAVELPPDHFSGSWAREGIVETAPRGIGRRQWWLAQMLSSVHPDHWLARFGLTPQQIVAAAAQHDLAIVLIDALTTAALRHQADAWYAPLYDVAAPRDEPRLTQHPSHELAQRLSSADAEPRMLSLLRSMDSGALSSFAMPWPRKLAEAFVSGLNAPPMAWSALLPIAALALPVDLLPETVPIPELSGHEIMARNYLRALDHFQFIASTRRALAQEISP